jgi:hypothetical protein
MEWDDDGNAAVGGEQREKKLLKNRSSKNSEALGMNDVML